ncbi:mpv17-like protein 2 [Centruroides sculpturatus]|uniref:mpv17-like protein 2 n=1 Tax=Centruroides sculpturatus TaxID=218467 RepID=UPI000C6D5D97|nr:mpv17-like protein 2 [Centruroides sculpturatus]
MAMINYLKRTVNKLFTRHLLLTNTAIAVGFMGAGDAIQQVLEKKLGEEKPFDKTRTRNMMGGGLVFGPLGHLWYSFLDRRFPGAKTSTVAKKLGCEMAIGPPLILVIFLSVGLLEGKPPKKSFNEFKDNIITICFVSFN